MDRQMVYLDGKLPSGKSNFMKWSYRIARISGIDIRIHVTFLLLLAYFGIMDWREGGSVAAVQGLTFTLLLFLCVLLHEFCPALHAILEDGLKVRLSTSQRLKLSASQNLNLSTS